MKEAGTAENLRRLPGGGIPAFLGLLAIAAVLLMVFFKPPGYSHIPAGHPHPRSFSCGEVEERVLVEACLRAEAVIQRDEELRELLAGKAYEVEIGGSYPPEEPEELTIGATIRFDRIYSFRINGKDVETNTLLIQIDPKREVIVRVDYIPM
ncbi:MAG: hypothetical protein GXO66_06255 [Euryarchaeota archaeon]|nr:hypothetical protein [Euryarchaeota archaeon]